ncbi:MAG: PepSY domain-containing protein [Bacilli bacterium]
MKSLLLNRIPWLTRLSAVVAVMAATAAFSVPSFAQTAVSAQQADQIALNSVPGGTLLHTSADHMNGAAVWDIHVAHNQQVWDVKVSVLSGAVLLKRLSPEQPSSSYTTASNTPAPSSTPSSTASSGAVTAGQAGQIAVSAVGGGTVSHVSSDHYQGAAVWDTHVLYNNQVWDVKVVASNGAVAMKKLSNEQSSNVQGGSGVQSGSSDQAGTSQSSDSKDAQDHQSGTIVSSSGNGVVFNQKLASVPSGYQSYVNQALSSVGGTLKWVKFSHKGSSDIQMNIKIRKGTGGTTKIKDVFSAAGQLLSQRAPTDN